MKKALLLLASAALLLVGCVKEQFSGQIEGGIQNVTFTASLENGVATKAVADGDGNAAGVNRCIMEIYFQDQLYKRMAETVSNKVATFANVPVVAGKQYQILFWADCGGAENADKYYTTNATAGLKAVAVKKEAFVTALAAGKNDELDAFFCSDNYTVPQAGGNYSATLKRPFAQVNVITTDVGEGQTVISEDLLPEKVSVSYTAANAINVATGEISGTETYSYEASVYGAWSTVTSTHKELTLSMDYLLASTEKGAVDVTFKTKNGETVVMTHSLANLPYQRNYRTNVKGNLLTTNGTWTATVDPIWERPDMVKVVEVADIKSANEIINQYAGTTKNLEVKFTGEPNDSGEPTGEESSPSRAIVTTPIQQNGSLSIEVLAQTKKLYIGDYPNEHTVTSVDTENAKSAVVNINVPETSSIVTLVINAPTKTVYINGKEVANVGTITSLDAIVSQHTLIIEKDQTIGTLTIRQGGLEIHGTVGTLVIDENDRDSNPVKVRTSENLSADVFAVIKGDDHDYIDRPDYSEKQNANGTWDIVPSVCKITETGTAYSSVADAFVAVANGQTIVMLQNDVLTKGQTIALQDNEAFTLDLNGKTISIAETGFDFSANGTNVALRSGVPMRFAIVVNGKGTMTICDNSTDAQGKIETDDYSYGTVKTILVDGNAVVNLNSGTVSADYSSFYVIGYTGTGSVPADAPKPTLNVNGGKIIGEDYAIGIKGNTASLKVNGGSIECEKYDAISTNGTQDWYDGGKFCIEITGGTIKSEQGAAMYLPAEGPTTISGGTFEGAQGIAVKGGSLTISGNAVIKATGAKDNPAAASSGHSNTGSCIYVEDTYPDHQPVVNITGGKFSSENNMAVEYYTTKADDAQDKGKVSISGGVFSSKPADALVAQYFQAVENTDATTMAQYPWTVKMSSDSPYVAKIGEVFYTSVHNALKSSKDNETIILLKDTDKGSDQYTSSCGNNITFDLNGHKIESNNNQGVFHFQMSSAKTITFVDSKGNGSVIQIDSNPSSDTYSAICAEGANVKIYSGYYEAKPSSHDWTQVLYAKAGNIYVYGGTFVGDLFTNNQYHHKLPDYYPEVNTIEIFDGVFTGKVLDSCDEDGVKSEVIIHGGKFSFDPTDYLAQGESLVAELGTDGYWTVSVELVRAVDLGLSVEWGDRNVGATVSTDHGGYFAWGETVARADAGDWSSYKYYDESSNSLTKYNTTDQIYVLKPEDDAASANIGGGWRMPTKVEMEELFNNCTKEVVANYENSGVKGLLFTAQNGETLFIPASGNIWDQIYNHTYEICCWCADKPTNGSAKAYAFDYISNWIDKDTGFSRCGLMPVRPVRSK